jgi:hypothetical protein
MSEYTGAEPRDKRVFPIGGIWEEREWKVFLDYVYNGESKCPHMVTRSGVLICPRVVVATNEGGYNTTGVCLDCIIEAEKTLPKFRVVCDETNNTPSDIEKGSINVDVYMREKPI